MDENNPDIYFALFNEINIIGQLSRALMDARLPKGLLTSHFGIINHLIRVRDGCTPLELARAFQVPKTTMTHTLSGLVSHKFVEIRSNLRDRRSKCVWLTEKGLQFRENTIIALQPDLVKIIAQLPPQKISSLVLSLGEIRKIMDSNRDGFPE